ncbi:hypothetical protein [Pelovirga terrestris]|uniref:HAMP domain-containing protein n=1 Tax=Pelovirga terrestris TaxID=2771352 RepID=A0A8J6QLN4_9BACT|nr:hypothetical protein [Pelovirga terrestris]MBD1400684.1 hypothetical protein [Pelovirga terrestris]
MANDQPTAQLDMIPRFFYRHIGICLSLFFVVVVLVWQVYLYFQTRVFLEAHYSAVMLKLMQIKEDVLLNSVITSLVFFAVPCLLAAAFLVYYSHRIAGPMYRIKRYLKEDLKQPKAQDLRFRESDVLHSLATAVNKVQHRYRADQQTLDQSLREIEDLLETVTSRHNAGEPVDVPLGRINVLCKKMQLTVEMVKK